MTKQKVTSYLCVSILRTPVNKAITSKKDWAKFPSNWINRDIVWVEDRVSNKAKREASAIIDILSGEVLKHRFDASNEMVAKTYLSKHSEVVDKGLREWSRKLMRQMAATPEYKKMKEAANAEEQETPVENS